MPPSYVKTILPTPINKRHESDEVKILPVVTERAKITVHIGIKYATLDL